MKYDRKNKTKTNKNQNQGIIPVDYVITLKLVGLDLVEKNS